MGSRLLRKWIVLPLREIKPIRDRLDITEFLVENENMRIDLQKQISQVGDMERLITRISLQRSSPREIIYLQKALTSISEVKILCEKSLNNSLITTGEQLNSCRALQEKIYATLEEDAPASFNKGNWLSTFLS